MKEIDWSKAPHGATHFRHDDPKSPWRMLKDGVWHAWFVGEWMTVTTAAEHFYIARPVWSGEGLPPVDYVKTRLSYDPATGIFTWLPRARNDFKHAHQYASWVSRCQGKAAGVCVKKKHKTYIRISISGVKVYAHVLAIAYMQGSWPDGEIDHINGDSEDNSYRNLRVVSHQENSRNVKLHRKSKSGYCGVNWHELTGKWRARVKVNGREYYVGLFDDPREAAEKIQALRVDLGFHENHGSTTRTPEQIAAEELKAAIDEMSEVTQGAHDWLQAFQKLHLAGYRKVTP